MGGCSAGRWAPAESPWTLQTGDSWFYSSSSGVHPPATLVEMYESSTGSNAVALIDIAPYANGSLPAEQVAAASALGNYIQSCYGRSAVATGAGTSNTLTIKPTINGTAAIDRIQLREDQRHGQRVRAFTLTAVLANGTTTTLCSGWNDWPRGGPNPTIAIGISTFADLKQRSPSRASPSPPLPPVMERHLSSRNSQHLGACRSWVTSKTHGQKDALDRLYEGKR